MTAAPYLSVVLPAYNEEDNLRRGVVRVVVDYLSSRAFAWELIIVNDGSTDSTASLLQASASADGRIFVLDHQHMGKQAAVIAGALAARGEIILFSDMDQATPISDFDLFLTHLSSGADVVIGSRSGRPNAPIPRRVLAYGNVLLRALILRLPVKDSQCGFKAFTRLVAQRVFTIMNRVHPPIVVSGPAVDPGFDVEFLYLIGRLGYRLAEIPVSWRHQETRRVSFFKDAIAGISGLFRVRWRSFTDRYGLERRH